MGNINSMETFILKQNNNVMLKGKQVQHKYEHKTTIKCYSWYKH